ncbi:lysozyme inhibitor LprI family protein [Chryseobacterium sp. Leaf394]|uniref:lysozyme inhibitor LprI family protein n=1 Tax=Chryseobacterium sp. Leaf394 TaxID=1736361 RepID=UPI000701C795|nr:lysozyme inhibitor LprI family protein [Chryseobacterium sp. Leaf394]KQS92117.1 hypothetical protein ASG21_06615 [Chryseobacterium sp. Leaf394]
MKKTVILFSLMFSSSVFAQTQAEMNKMAYDNYSKADKQLNLVYGEILKKYVKDQVFLKKLKVAQNLWIKFRDAQVAAKYPEEDKQYHYGTAFPVCYNISMQELTEQRTKELKVWLEKYYDGDVCSGSAR